MKNKLYVFIHKVLKYFFIRVRFIKYYAQKSEKENLFSYEMYASKT